MGNLYGHWVDLQAMTFDDGEGTWIQALPLGTYEHPVYGTIEVTPEKVQEFAANVQNKVRGQDLDIDYDHKANDKIAAGWVAAADARADGLYLQVKWTDKALGHLKAKEYRYFSPEFQDEWVHPKSKATHKNVLFGGALTNRPFLKDILPINLSEMTKMADGPNPPAGGGSDGGGSGDGAPQSQSADKVISEIAKLLNLDPNGSPDLILGALQVKLKVPGNTNPKDPASPDAGAGGAAGVQPPKPPAPPTHQPAPMMGEGVEGLKLSEEDKKNPTIVKMAEMLQGVVAIAKSQGESIKTLSEKNRELEVDAALVKLSDGKTTALAPVVRDEARAILLEKDPTKLSEGLLALLEKVSEGKAVVQLGEIGGARTANGDESAVKKFTEAVQKFRTDNAGATYSDAVHAVGVANPELQMGYLQGIRVGETV